VAGGLVVESEPPQADDARRKINGKRSRMIKES
jgi:hypothetical protein